MASSATNTFYLQGVEPLYQHEVARISVKLPNSVTYARGTVLGELTGTNAVQTITISATGGTFTITFGAQTTGALAYNATAAVVQSALEGLSSIGVNNIAVTLSGSVYTLTFQNALGSGPRATVTTNPASLTGGGGTANAASVTTGVVATLGTYKAWDEYGTDGSQFAKAILEYDCATDSSGNITFGGASGGGDKGQTWPVAPAFIKGSFATADLVQSGVGMICAANVAQLGRLVEGTTVNGVLSLV
jgi:hypothetical protein